MNNTTTILSHFRTHLIAAGRASGTIAQRVRHMERLSSRHPDLFAVTVADLESHLELLVRIGLTAETRKAWRSSFLVFYGWAERSGLIDRSPAYDLAPISIPVTVARSCPDRVFFDATERATPSERAMLMLGRYAGLRLSEITRLNVTNRLPGDVLFIVGKGAHQRLVPAPSPLARALDVLEQEDLVVDGWYFPGRFGGHLHPQSVEKIIQRRLGWNPHSLRHAAATSSFRKTRNVRAVQAFLGHASMATTQRYLGIDMDELRAVADATVITGPWTRVTDKPPERLAA